MAREGNRTARTRNRVARAAYERNGAGPHADRRTRRERDRRAQDTAAVRRSQRGE